MVTAAMPATRAVIRNDARHKAKWPRVWKHSANALPDCFFSKTDAGVTFERTRREMRSERRTKVCMRRRARRQRVLDICRESIHSSPASRLANSWMADESAPVRISKMREFSGNSVSTSSEPIAAHACLSFTNLSDTKTSISFVHAKSSTT
jgi:hypothetical protein